MAVSLPCSEAQMQPGGAKCSDITNHSHRGCGGLIPKELYADAMVTAQRSLLGAHPHHPNQANLLGVSSGLTDRGPHVTPVSWSWLCLKSLTLHLGFHRYSSRSSQIEEGISAGFPLYSLCLGPPQQRRRENGGACWLQSR